MVLLLKIFRQIAQWNLDNAAGKGNGSVRRRDVIDGGVGVGGIAASQKIKKIGVGLNPNCYGQPDDDEFGFHNQPVLFSHYGSNCPNRQQCQFRLRAFYFEPSDGIFCGGAVSGGASSESSFAELLLGALRVPDVAHGLFVRPTLLPRLAEAARGRFARLDSTLREIRFHGFTFNFSAVASLR
jgi:hypothetical protein